MDTVPHAPPSKTPTHEVALELRRDMAFLMILFGTDSSMKRVRKLSVIVEAVHREVSLLLHGKMFYDAGHSAWFTKHWVYHFPLFQAIARKIGAEGKFLDMEMRQTSRRKLIC
jgi:hypothetical protein